MSTGTLMSFEELGVVVHNAIINYSYYWLSV